MTKASDNEFPSVLFDEQGSNPSTPASGLWRAYFKSDGMYVIDDAGATTGPFIDTGGDSDVTVVRKASDETVNNSSTLQNDDTLLYALAANEEVAFECEIWFESGATPDFKAAFTVPAAATIKWAPYGVDTGPAVIAGGVIIQASGTAQAFAGSATPQRHALIKGMVINSTNAGNLQLQWAQDTANASDTKVLKNSTLIVRTLA